MRISVQFHRPEFLKSDNNPNLKDCFRKEKDNPVDVSNNVARRAQVLKQQSRASRYRLLGELVTISRNSAEMTKLAKAIRVPPAPGEVPQLNENAWATLSDFDAKRRAGNNFGNMPNEKILQEINRVATEKEHPCCKDAELLLEIMTRPIDESAPSLEGYLSELVSTQVKETIGQDFETTPKLDFTKADDIVTFVRTFNGIMQGVSLNSQDYASIGRTLLVKGAIHLAESAGEPASATGTSDNSENDSLSARLQKVTFCFPTVPSEGKHKLELNDFNMNFNYEIMDFDPNPLEERFGNQLYLDPASFKAQVEPIS